MYGKQVNKIKSTRPAWLMLCTVITQCCMRHLYVSEPRVPELVELAQTFERRRCNHHTLKEPLTALECLKGVVDPKGSGTNRNRYVVASQSLDVRAAMRRIPGVPLIYLNRSVMILEPMARITEDARERSEKGKFRAMLKDKRAGPDASKRKTASVATIGVTLEGTIDGIKPSTAQDEATAKKRKRGPKGPNPLSVKKPRKRVRDEALEAQHQPADDASEAPRKRKRRRKHGPAGRGQEGQETS